MSAQLPPAPSQRCHWWVKAIAGVPVQAPSCAVRTDASVVVPETDGGVVSAGGSAATTALWGDALGAGPAMFVAPTTPRIVLPAAAGGRALKAPPPPGSAR